MEDFERVMHINSTGGFICTQALCRAMQLQTSRSITTRNGIRDIGRGAIVNVASAMAYAPVAGKVGYTASKHALLGITKSAGKLEQYHLYVGSRPLNDFLSAGKCFFRHPCQRGLSNLGTNRDV